MPKLSATRTYADNQSPVQSDFDAFIDDIEILVNTIQLDDDNFQDGGIDGGLFLQDSTVNPAVIRNNNITTAKIADNAVTTAKLDDDAVTTAKIAANAVTQAKASILSGYLPTGSVQMFHTFNGTVSYPRGWMLCNGDIVNETNYDAIHGAGAYTADSVASSPLLSKNLPDMADKFAVGVADTTKDGSSAITSVGNTGNQVDLSHTHDTTHDHTTGVGDILVPPGSDVFAGPQPIGQPIRAEDDAATTASSLSATQSIQPDSVRVLYILKVV